MPPWLIRLIRPRFCSRHDKAVTRWHHRRCKHYVIVLDELVSGELLRAGNQLYRIASEAYRLSRSGDQVMSLGQRDTMFYALQRWERASGDRNADSNRGRGHQRPAMDKGARDQDLPRPCPRLSAPAQDYGSEGWGFESLRARFSDQQ